MQNILEAYPYNRDSTASKNSTDASPRNKIRETLIMIYLTKLDTIILNKQKEPIVILDLQIFQILKLLHQISFRKRNMNVVKEDPMRSYE